jgi:RNA polymerase sigma-70 factor (ECF subfamily)
MAENIQIEANKDATKGDEAAVLRAAQDSLVGFKQLYLHWLTPVYRYFYFRTGNVKDAEDLTSQVFLKVYEELPRYRDRGRFSAWLFTIVRNKAVDFFRSTGREIPLETIDPVDGSYDLLAQVVHSDEIQRLNRLIRSLPDDEQELIRLRFVADLGYREIGEVLNRKEDAARKTISRLLARLQSQLEASHE